MFKFYFANCTENHCLRQVKIAYILSILRRRTVFIRRSIMSTVLYFLWAKWLQTESALFKLCVVVMLCPLKVHIRDIKGPFMLNFVAFIAE